MAVKVISGYVMNNHKIPVYFLKARRCTVVLPGNECFVFYSKQGSV